MEKSYCTAIVRGALYADAVDLHRALVEEAQGKIAFRVLGLRRGADIGLGALYHAEGPALGARAVFIA